MLTLVVAVRDWPEDRVTACVRSFAPTPASILSEVLIVDFGSAQPLAGELFDDPRVRILRLESDTWSIAEAINAAPLLTANPVIAKVDADILLAPDSIDAFVRAVHHVAGGHAALLLAQTVDLPSGVSVEAAREAIANGVVPEGSRLRPKWGQGALVVFDRAAWGRIGGYDSRFTGWGGEDNDFVDRMRRSGQRVEWADRDALRIYHVAHPLSYVTAAAAKARQRNNAIMHGDRSILRPLAFRHSNALDLCAPNIIQRELPHVTLAIATGARPGRDRMILEALDSFRGQIDNDFEAVIVDNGSPDESYQALRRALRQADWLPSVRLEHASTASIPAARNQITDMARGRYTCIVDDDDIALPNRLADHLACFTQDGTIHGSHGGWIDFDETTGQIERNPGKERRLATLVKGRGKTTAHPACLYRTDVLRAMPYDQSLDLGSDLDLALRMAAMGLHIAHTGSFVTLRRFHAANVTITGQSNQAANGMRARDRLWSSFNRRYQDELLAQALEWDLEAECRNHLSINELAALLPPYVGEWHLVVPIDTIERAQAAKQDAAGGPVLEVLYELLGGDIGTQRNGADQAIALFSDPVRGLAKARELAAEVASIVGEEPVYLSTAQHAADRGTGVDWAAHVPGRDACILRSSRVEDLAEMLVKLREIKEDTLLRKVVRIVSDGDNDGPFYYLATTPLGHAADVHSLRATLGRLTGLTFEPVGPRGLPGNPMLLGDKVH